MWGLFNRRQASPIGLDIGSRSVKLAQFSMDHGQLIDAVRWDLPGDFLKSMSQEQQAESFAEAITRAREGHEFVGKDVVLCLNDKQLFLQNIRVPKGDPMSIARAVHQEAAGRIPYPVNETDIRYLEAADVRQGDAIVREVILMACHRPVLDRSLEIIERAGLNPVAVDVEPAALLRAYCSQYRRDEDRRVRSLIVHVGNGSTLIQIAQDQEILFVKYLDIGGKHMDEAVGRALRMDQSEATALRRHNGDRRGDRQDPEISRSIQEATRPIVERLTNELAMCIRYHSVTFRGQPLGRLLVGGGEATPALLESLSKRLGLKGELSDPFRVFESHAVRGRLGQWDVAAGLALRNLAA